MMAIKSFRGEYFFLSNFFPCKIIYDEIEYPTLEHAYQASKTLKQSMREMISKLGTPSEAKRIGKRLENRSNWKQINLGIMEELVWQKFSGNVALSSLLLATGDEELVEGNAWGDEWWGVDARTGRGENRLGKILMKARERLRNDGKRW